MHTTTGQTPFQANLGLNPRSADWPNKPLGEGESPLGKEKVEQIHELQTACRKGIERANEYSRNYADKKRLPILFKQGDEVLISNKHIRSTRPKKKLDWKYLGPGRILAQIGPSAFKVDLPSLNRVHPVFHASLLELYIKTGQIQQPQVQIAEPLRTTAEDVYKVEKITDRRKDNNDK
jgi:hypothetical protein